MGVSCPKHVDYCAVVVAEHPQLQFDLPDHAVSTRSCLVIGPHYLLMASRRPCYCSVCILDTFEDDDGKNVPGTLQTSKTRKNHELSDAKREKRAAMNVGRLEAQVLATTLENAGESAGRSSIVRPRDLLGAPSLSCAEQEVSLSISCNADGQ